MDSIMNAKYTIGKYEIYSLCYQSSPCQHYVKNNDSNKVKRMSGDKIYVMLKKDGLSHPHFDVYEEYIRKRDNPTAEELSI